MPLINISDFAAFLIILQCYTPKTKAKTIVLQERKHEQKQA
ncbi:hypothetical protein APA_3982 [Pseudanabaena sp. lw0831]|nr:hypothetical protein APA_3982 [Pseudanabaena sp. lw0831]